MRWMVAIGFVLSFSFAGPSVANEANAPDYGADAFQLLEILNQNEVLSSEIATLRGVVEVLLEEVEQSNISRKTIAADFDRRIELIESNPAEDTSEDKDRITELEDRILQLEEALTAMHEVISSTGPAVVQTNPADDAYEAALETYTDGDYESAIIEFEAFLEQYGSEAIAANARYWLAEALLRQTYYGSAIETGETLISVHPESDKVPDTIFLLGKAYLAMGDAYSARDTWETLVVDHADTGAAEKARELLDRLP